LWYAENLLEGYFSPPEYVFLWSGPGYPLFLAPFVALDVPLDVLRCMNGVLLGAAQVVFFFFVRQFARAGTAALFTLLFTLYLPLVNTAHLLYTEALSVLLIVTLISLLLRALRDGRLWSILAGGSAFGALVLTKVGFWPMLFGGLALSLALFVWKRDVAFKRLSFCLAVGVVWCVPYLVHTYGATGRVFYWGAGSGSIMYWITNPTEGSYGEHLNPNHVKSIPQMRRDHWPLIKRLGRFDGQFEKGATGKEKIARSLYHISSPETDDALAAQAKQNLIAHPDKYLKNVGYNVLRLVFDAPHIVRQFGPDSQRLAICNPLVLLGLAFAAARLIRRRGPEPHLALFVGWVLAGYLVIVALLACVGRYFIPIAPLALALIALAFAAPVDAFFERRAKNGQGRS
jgi:4-amino-4-deoxy-L-arabinose transferase-like glycosyltransferase